MKSRIRRFWISVSLATGSLAFPLSSSLWSHDLPIRWTSGANSTPSWNQLLDDCLDQSQLAGPRSLLDSDATVRRGTEDWASSCPAEWTQALSCGAVASVPTLDTDLLGRNPLSRFSKEMTCWVNEWQDYTHSAIDTPAPSSFTFAARPDEGQPPAPGVGQVDAEDLVTFDGASGEFGDTCAFDAEFQARAAAADLLAAEMARAADVAANEARLAQALGDAAAVESQSRIDEIPVETLTGHLVAKNVSQPSRCGGPIDEIISENCFPNRFAPGMIDEYLAYDLTEADSHWLGGLGKSWKLRSALANSRWAASRETNVVAETYAADYVAPESYVAPDQLAGSGDEPLLTYQPTTELTNELTSELSDEPAAFESATLDDTAQLNNYLDQLIQSAQHSATAMLDRAVSAIDLPEPTLTHTTESLPDWLPSLQQQIIAADTWILQQQNLIAAELCGFDHAYSLGQLLGSSTTQVAQTTISNYVAMGSYLQFAPELVVVYEDSDGSQMVVPGSIARAWNRPESDNSELAQAMEPAAEATDSASNEVVLDMHKIRDQAIEFIAQQLDAVGMACLQTSDQLVNWSKVARQKAVDVR